MKPERDLDTLLVSMKPRLDANEWVFSFVDSSVDTAALEPIGLFVEAEGTTIVILRSTAEAHGLAYEFRSNRITLSVNSSLDAVGFLAEITQALRSHLIPANVISAYHHDHIFVPVDRSAEALRVLDDLSSESARRLL